MGYRSVFFQSICLVYGMLKMMYLFDSYNVMIFLWIERHANRAKKTEAKLRSFHLSRIDKIFSSDISEYKS